MISIFEQSLIYLTLRRIQGALLVEAYIIVAIAAYFVP